MAEPEKKLCPCFGVNEKSYDDKPDILVLPETLNVGFFPTEHLKDLSDVDGVKTKLCLEILPKNIMLILLQAVLLM